MATATSGKSISQSEILNAVADETGLTRSQVRSVLDGVVNVVRQQLGKKGSGTIKLAGLVKIERRHKAAVKGGVKKTNPFTGEPMVTKSKPACNIVKVRALKALKEMV